MSLPLPCPSGDTDTSGRSSSSSVAFTADQRQELERQTIIYKYMMASMPVPPQLLLPLSKYPTTAGAVTTAATSGGRGGGGDPEPWRCRRTDGKKWRCSRDVAPDQKYCERHSHKGRPSARSRKPVESILSPTPSPTPTSASYALDFSSPLLPYSLLPNPRSALFPHFHFFLDYSCSFSFLGLHQNLYFTLFSPLFGFFWGLVSSFCWWPNPEHCELYCSKYHPWYMTMGSKLVEFKVLSLSKCTLFLFFLFLGWEGVEENSNSCSQKLGLNSFLFFWVLQ